MSATVRPTVFVVTTHPCDLSTSFIRAHVERLPANVVPMHGYLPQIGDRPMLTASWPARALHKLERTFRGHPWEYEISRAYAKVFRKRRGPAAVLAEYGPTGARVAEGCRLAGIPLIVHFHGYDASVHSVIAAHDNYRRLFETAAGIIGVSNSMCARLIALGAPAEKVQLNPCGVDSALFHAGNAESAPPVFLAVGRFVEKKAPHLTILAFAETYGANRDARLRMIGDGPLMGPCRDLVASLNLAGAVTFLGEQGADVIAEEMRRARCFVQHSVEALNGDCEGTPVAILEAGASGLPVVSTRHSGIVDAVRESETGFLVDERDVRGMAAAMARLVADPEMAGRMGRAARQRVESLYAMERQIDRLWTIIGSAIEGRPVVESGDLQDLARTRVASRNREPLPGGASAPAVRTPRAPRDPASAH